MLTKEIKSKKRKDKEMVQFDKKNTDHYNIFQNASKIKTKENARLYFFDFAKHLSTQNLTIKSKMNFDEIIELAKSKLKLYFKVYGDEEDWERFNKLFEL